MLIPHEGPEVRSHFLRRSNVALVVYHLRKTINCLLNARPFAAASFAWLMSTATARPHHGIAQHRYEAWAPIPRDRWERRRQFVSPYPLATKRHGATSDLRSGIAHDCVERFEHPELRRKVIALHRQWRRACNSYALVIENKGSGMGLIQDLKRENIHAIPINPEGDKTMRNNRLRAWHVLKQRRPYRVA